MPSQRDREVVLAFKRIHEVIIMKLGKIVSTAVVAGAMLFGLAACEKEGPAERAGKEADKAVADVGKQIEKVGESIQDAAKGDNKKKY
jgi:predicted small lipoprotein YifL